MKTLLSIMVVISIAFSFFTLNSDFSKETVDDNVHNTDTKVVAVSYTHLTLPTTPYV